MPSRQVSREELVETLKAFDALPVIERYRECWVGKPAAEILVRQSIRRYTAPLRMRRLHGDTGFGDGTKEARRAVEQLEALRDQVEFDRFALAVGRSLGVDWGTTNDAGGPSRMNIGVAMKMANVVLKHLHYSRTRRQSRTPGRTASRALGQVHASAAACSVDGRPAHPAQPEPGLVRTLELYHGLHAFISGICRDANVPRIWYEIWAWDSAHQASTSAGTM